MKKSLKIFAIIVMVIIMLFTTVSVCFAESSADSIISGISPDTSNINTSGMQTITGRVLGLLQVISALLAVILIAYLGFKMLLGSANEKADVQKQFIPLIIGVVIVFAATSIARLLLGIMTVPESTATAKLTFDVIQTIKIV